MDHWQSNSSIKACGKPGIRAWRPVVFCGAPEKEGFLYGHFSKAKNAFNRLIQQKNLQPCQRKSTAPPKQA